MMASEEDQRPLGFDDYVVSLGDELRGERATLGKSLLDVQRDLKIKASYIAAIENCDPSVFPNHGFVAGYVRSYARFLGMDSEWVFRRFCQESGFTSINAEMVSGGKKQTQRAGTIHGMETGLGSNSMPNLAMPRLNGDASGLLDNFSPSGIASLMVLMLLIGGLGFGGWTVLQDIQRVEFAPVNQTPGVVADVRDINTPSNEAIGPSNVSIAMATPVNDPMEQLYRPQELALPQLEPRDGPIASIDPNSVGALAQAEIPEELQVVSLPEVTPEIALPDGPVMTIAPDVPEMSIYAARAAWVRIYEKDGAVIFEKILEKGERYTVPVDAAIPMLRAGNSGSVYLIKNGVPYGPVGKGTSVAKGVSLTASEVETRFEFAEIELPVDPIVQNAEVQNAGVQFPTNGE